MRRRKASGYAGPNPIEWPDIDAFLRRSGHVLTPWDIDIFLDIDDAFLNAWTNKDKRGVGARSKKLTRDAFDQMFSGMSKPTVDLGPSKENLTRNAFDQMFS